MAEALEHEIDHLDGRLYIDHIESADRLHKVGHPITQIEGGVARRETL
jgi:peptide deformylase